MGSLLPKLGNLLVEEYKLQTGIKEDIEYMKRELTSMETALRKVGDVPRDKLDQQVKNWADEVRDLSYIMEDIIDKFLVRVNGAEFAEKPHKLKLLIKKTGELFTKGMARYEISNEIKAIKIRVQEAADRRDRYKVNEEFSWRMEVAVDNPPVAIMADPRLMALYKDKKYLVGIDGPLNELTHMLSDGHGDMHKQLKIFSVFGFGGLGKTTLAKELYDKLKFSFDCIAFVPVGRNPSVKNLLSDILFEIENNKYPELNERQLIDKLRGLLENKRYFIVIDDIWDTETWDMVRCAFVDNSCASRIITTTRILDVATKTGEVYKLQPLSRGLSEELFHSRIFGVNSKCTSDLPTEVYEKILQRCSGVPLAIITIASLLVYKPVEFWPNIYSSIGFGHENNKDVENTRKILLFSYYDLPCHLKNCLLHLSIYPEDHFIEKDSLIWLWVGEGFIPEEPGVGLYEIGQRYFNELINRSMVLPVEDPYEYIIYGCRVHDLVLDMICVLAKEENFVTILDSNEEYTSIHTNARRLAIRAREVPLGSTPMLQVRSLNTMSYVDKLSFTGFQVLRVLNVQYNSSYMHMSNHVEHIVKLVHLRYLRLGNEDIRVLPKEMGYLKFLQALYGGLYTMRLPEWIGLLSQLKCLIAPYATITAADDDWIGNLTSLEELWVKDVDVSSNFAREVGKITELRKLRIGGIFKLNGPRSIKAWVESLVKLQKIQVIHVGALHSKGTHGTTSYWEGYVPPQQLRVFKLNYHHPGVLASIKSSWLPNLSHLYVHVDSPDVDIFGRFPGLVYLELYMERPAQGHFLMGGAGVGLFPRLRVFKTSETPGPFLPGAMPSLEYLQFSVDVWRSRDGDLHFECDMPSFVNLPMLQKVTIIMWSDERIKKEDWWKAQETARHAIDIHPNRPALQIVNFRGQMHIPMQMEYS